jgi:dynactin complex subunit
MTYTDELIIKMFSHLKIHEKCEYKQVEKQSIYNDGKRWSYNCSDIVTSISETHDIKVSVLHVPKLINRYLTIKPKSILISESLQKELSEKRYATK